MHHVFDTLVCTIAPFAVHLAEELHGFRHGADPTQGPATSVMLNGWRDPSPTWSNPTLAGPWEDVRALRRVVFRAVEDAKLSEVVKSTSEAHVHLFVPPSVHTILESTCGSDGVGGGGRSLVNGSTSPSYSLSDVFLCASLTLDCNESSASSTSKSTSLEEANTTSHAYTEASFRGHGPVTVHVQKTHDEKCPRCWRYVCPPPLDNGHVCARCSEVLGSRA